MASYTPNLNLKKPAGSENVSIGDINTNMDAIDTAYGTLNGNLATMLDAASKSVVSDFNTCKTAGTYKGSSNSTSNTPGTGYWIVFVLRYSANDLIQLSFEVNDGRTVVRAFHDGQTWTEWKRLDNV